MVFYCLLPYFYSDTDLSFIMSSFCSPQLRNLYFHFAEFPTYEVLPPYFEGNKIIHEVGEATFGMRRGPKVQRQSAWSHGSPHPCSRCGKVYTWRTNLLRHLRLECGKEPHCQCPYCPYITNHKTTLQEHIRRKHKNMPNVL